MTTTRHVARLMLAFATAACSPDDAPDDAAAPTEDAGDAGEAPVVLPLDADPNGLFWDAASGTLFIADDDGNRVLTWTDGAGFGAPRALPEAPPDGPGLGQLTRLSDGTILVARFGAGTAGAVLVSRPDGTHDVVPGLALDRRRLGLAVGADDVVYGTWFVSRMGMKLGAVARLDLAGAEVDLLGGLVKPVGVAVDGDTLYASDQDEDEILRCSLPACADARRHAALESPDLLTLGPDGSLFTGSRDGHVYRIARDGTVSVLAGGFQQPRGTAYDAARRRLFVADHDGDPTDGTEHRLWIVPLP